MFAVKALHTNLVTTPSENDSSYNGPNSRPQGNHENNTDQKFDYKTIL